MAEITARGFKDSKLAFHGKVATYCQGQDLLRVRFMLRARRAAVCVSYQPLRQVLSQHPMTDVQINVRRGLNTPRLA